MPAKMFTVASGQRIACYKSRGRFQLYIDDSDSDTHHAGVALANLDPGERWRLLQQLCPELQRLRSTAECFVENVRKNGEPSVTEHLEWWVELFEEALFPIPEHWSKA